MKKGFTLAEIMIALVVIGVITSILLPVAFNNVSNENVMKFKKGNATLAKVINELVTSGEYYKEGDLGVKADGTLIDGTHDGDVTFFCETFSEIVNIKRKHCNSLFYKYAALWVDTSYYNGKTADYENDLDEACKSLINSNSLEAEIITSDGILFFQTNPKDVFGISIKNAHAIAMFENPCNDCNNRNYLYHGFDQNGNVSPFYNIYKVFCMDIDGINKGEDPFGYGIRVDGKIILGKRATEWLEKSIQEK